jgi:hydrogenase nickel incorporation protein HypB
MVKNRNIPVEQDIIKLETEAGLENKKRFDHDGIKVFNVMGAVGSGKTSLIEAAIERLKGDHKIAVISGDLVADYDSKRYEAHGIPVISVNTGKECHLNANQITDAIQKLKPGAVDLLFIENVGNLICPTEFYLGEHKRVIVVSVTEGEDTVAKRPVVFKTADLVMVNKVDLAKVMDVNPDKMVSDALGNAPLAFKTSVRTGIGIKQWIDIILETLV